MDIIYDTSICQRTVYICCCGIVLRAAQTADKLATSAGGRR